MKISALPAYVATALLAYGCSAEQYYQVTAAVKQARSGAAIRLATSATLAEMAVMHLAAALSRDAAKHFDEESAPTLTGNSKSDFTYKVDPQSGTGSISRVVDSKKTVDLRFAFESAEGNAGKSYAVTKTEGHFEGYEMLFQRLTVTFSAVLGDKFLPERHENGNILLHVSVNAKGSLGTAKVEAVRLTSLVYDFNYPVSETDARIGSLQATNSANDTFVGSVSLIDGSLKIQGDLKGHDDSFFFKLNTNARGEIDLEEVPAARQAG